MNKLKQLRISKSLTQSELAKELNIGQSAISKWEKGKTIPDVTTLKSLSAFYNVPIEELLQNDPAPQKPFIQAKSNQPLSPLQRRCLNYIVNLNEIYLEKAESYLNALYNISKWSLRKNIFVLANKKTAHMLFF